MRYPSLDLHGEYAVTVYTVVEVFLRDHRKLRNEYVVLIHGKGSGKLKEEVHNILAKDKNVLDFHLDPWNLGQTIVHLKLD